MNNSIRTNSKFAAVAVGTFLVCSASAIACQVPVFRYALERWLADRYRITVIHQEPLSETQNSTLDKLRHVADAKGAAIDIRIVDLSEEDKVSPKIQRQWQATKDRSQPLMLVDYPAANRVPRTKPLWPQQFNKTTVSQLLDSPVRKKIAKRLSAGDSAVWVFVPCGRDSDDKPALERLQAQIREDAEWLQLPSAEELEVKPEVLEQCKVPLRIQFSTVTLNREDPAESFLLESLISSEEDLVEFDQPLAFPVFGRGRVLYALVGKGITSDTIRAASAFIAGPCSCQVKNQNPGFDLLLQSNWDDALGDVLISEPIESVDREANAPKLLTIPPGRQGRK